MSDQTLLDEIKKAKTLRDTLSGFDSQHHDIKNLAQGMSTSLTVLESRLKGVIADAAKAKEQADKTARDKKIRELGEAELAKQEASETPKKTKS